MVGRRQVGNNTAAVIYRTLCLSVWLSVCLSVWCPVSRYRAAPSLRGCSVTSVTCLTFMRRKTVRSRPRRPTVRLRLTTLAHETPSDRTVIPAKVSCHRRSSAVIKTTSLIYVHLYMYILWYMLLLLSPVYTIQPVVKPVVKRVWQPVKCLYARYNRLSNPFDNRLYRVYSRLSVRLSNRLYNHVWQPAVSCKQTSNRLTGLTTGCMFVYTIQPVVKPVVQLVWQPVVLCKRGLTTAEQLGE